MLKSQLIRFVLSKSSLFARQIRALDWDSQLSCSIEMLDWNPRSRPSIWSSQSVEQLLTAVGYSRQFVIQGRIGQIEIPNTVIFNRISSNESVELNRFNLADESSNCLQIPKSLVKTKATQFQLSSKTNSSNQQIRFRRPASLKLANYLALQNCTQLIDHKPKKVKGKA